MLKRAQRVLVLLLTVVLVGAFVSHHAGAKIVGPPVGGDAGRTGNGAKSDNVDPCATVDPPALRRPWTQNNCYRIVASDPYQVPEPPDWSPTHEWRWAYKVDARFQGGIEKVAIQWDPGYPKNVDELSHTKTLRYDLVGTTEGTYYVEDKYRDWHRQYYDLVRLERGRVSFRWLCWVRVWKREHWRRDLWNDGAIEHWLVSTQRSTLDGPGEVNPDSICNLSAYSSMNVSGWMYFSEDSPPIKAPPIYQPIPPSGVVPPPVFSGHEAYLGGREVLKDDYKYEDGWGKGGTWLFGGRPVQNLFAAARGETTIVGIRTLAQGDPRVKPALNKVTEVIVSVDGIPKTAVRAALSSGTAQRGRWIATVHVPVGTKIGRYRIVFDIRGTNYWGHPRRKIVYAWLQVTGGNTVDPGCKPWQKDCGRKVGFCGLDEDDMRRMGDVWRYECIDPRLVK